MSDSSNDPLFALSPLDGRYHLATRQMANCFSEFALIKRRVEIEIAWLKSLLSEEAIREGFGGAIPSADKFAQLDSIADNFGEKDAVAIKTLERKTRHDVKAAEVWLASQLAQTPFAECRTLIHFACTSWDINNLAYTLMMRDGGNALLASLRNLHPEIHHRANLWAGIPMLARTHGQPASPTTIGKEFAVFAFRLQRQIDALSSFQLEGKFNGATGNYNAHYAAFPNFDWPQFCRRFVEGFELEFIPLTTQINSYDNAAEYFDLIRRINSIILDFCRDMWGYISLDYFKQKTDKNEVGSSTMPHKVNPIDFENAEGNIGIANALLGHLSEKLPVSRWQRDLSDSTVIRNIGVAFAHSHLAYQSAAEGIRRAELNPKQLAADLEANPQVLAEAAQTILRASGDIDSFEKLRAFTQGGGKDLKTLREFIAELNLSEEEKKRFFSMTPSDYIGIADKLARDC